MIWSTFHCVVCLLLYPAPNDKMKDMLRKTVSEAKVAVSNVSDSRQYCHALCVCVCACVCD